MCIIRNVLPGGQGETKWFDRFNDFQRQETVRQIEFKRKHWPELPDGLWSKNRSRSYPHILPDGEMEKALCPEIAAAVLAYCGTEIAIHSEALNLKSSQVCCFNSLFPLRQDLPLARSALADVLPDVTEVEWIEFEYTGPADVTAWLGEPRTGKRGSMRTSIDAAIRWRSGTQEALTFCEWKYTEKNYGLCAGANSDRNPNPGRCAAPNLSVTQYADGCYLRESLGRSYWSLFDEAGIDVAALSDGTRCPLRGAFYQLMRQYLVAHYERVKDPTLNVQVVALSFSGNTALHEVSSDGTTVEERWNRCLQKPEQALRTIHVESIINRARAAAGEQHQTWLDYLNERYGL